jgi:hypothetical protein
MAKEFVIDEETELFLQADSDCCCVECALNAAAELRTYFRMDRPQAERHAVAAGVRRVLIEHGFVV